MENTKIDQILTVSVGVNYAITFSLVGCIPSLNRRARFGAKSGQKSYGPTLDPTNSETLFYTFLYFLFNQAPNRGLQTK